MSQRQGSFRLNIDTYIPRTHYLTVWYLLPGQHQLLLALMCHTIWTVESKNSERETMANRWKEFLGEFDISTRIITKQICWNAESRRHYTNYRLKACIKTPPTLLADTFEHKLQAYLHIQLLIMGRYFHLSTHTYIHTLNQSLFVHRLIHPQQQKITALITELLKSLHAERKEK